MLVAEQYRKVVLDNDIDHVAGVIPSAARFDLDGTPMLAVPHRLDETRVMRNLGVAVPSPILYYYDWPRMEGIDPFDAQRETAAFLTLNSRAYVLSQMGTGKSLSTLWAADYLMSIGQVRRVLILSPLSTLDRVWGDEIFKHLPHRKYTVLHHRDRKRRQRLLAEDTDFYIINHDGVKVVLDGLKARDDIDLIVIDELSVFRNASTDRWKALRSLAADTPRVWGLTGTPIPNDPTDAWAQARLITPESAPKYFSAFRDQTMRQVGPYRWVPRDNALEAVQRALTPSIRFTRDDCMDLPPAMHETRQVPLTVEQTAAYKTMMEKLHMEYAEGTVTAANEGVKLSKLLQIASGIVYTIDGGVVHLPCQPRIDELMDTIVQAGTKVIVFAIFTETLHMLEAALSKHWSVGVVHGETSQTQRNSVLANFQNARHPHVLLAHPRTTSHGLTLTEASTIIWYTPTTSNEQYEQANDRIQRSGQKNQPYIIHMESTAAERRVYSRLRNKQSTQGLLLEMMEGTNDEI